MLNVRNLLVYGSLSMLLLVGHVEPIFNEIITLMWCIELAHVSKPI